MCNKQRVVSSDPLFCLYYIAKCLSKTYFVQSIIIDGNPNNHLKGLQTVMLPASGGAVVEFTVTRPGSYPIVTHQFNHAQKGAVAILKVTETGEDDGTETSGH
ncbi:nitrite reductase [Parageobacillus genomosp. 1]|jgi:nitrite reductase (NO-forming)|uniref:Nitrite reductase n=1 Tax=Parageobacillus genomosp. 1 TaxID=1295642 RepID=A0ABC9VIX5_9BACL|nr:nitrite reductase [Parageobacillus genomosp. 1]